MNISKARDENGQEITPTLRVLSGTILYVFLPGSYVHHRLRCPKSSSAFLMRHSPSLGERYPAYLQGSPGGNAGCPVILPSKGSRRTYIPLDKAVT